MTADITGTAPITQDLITPPVEDRRKHPRFAPLGLTVAVNGRAATMLDISVGGVKVGGHGLKQGDRVNLVLEARFPGGAQRAETRAIVVAVVAGKASIKFDHPTYALMRFIVHYLAHRHGVAPHAFR